MRRRLLTSTLAVAVITVVLLGLPLAFVGSRLIMGEAQQQLQREAQVILSAVEYQLARDRPVRGHEIARTSPSRHIEIRLPDDRTLTAGEPYGPGALSQSVTGPGGVRVTVSRSSAALRQPITRVILLVAGTSIAALGVAVGLAVAQARRLSLPLVDLAVTAERLGSGEARPRRTRYGIPELDRVAEVLDRSAERIGDLIGAERKFAIDASHQLRTPLAALSMRLEELLAASDEPEVVREEASAALTQAERLTAVVDQLLAHAHRSRTSTATPIDVDAVVHQQVEEWGPAFKRAGRRIEVAGSSGLRALATPGGLAQVLATLLDNSLVHGGGTATVRTSGSGRSIVVEVADEGPGVPSELVSEVFLREVSGGDSTGLGLALARALAEADGGRLELVQPGPPVFAVFLRPPSEGSEGSEGPAGGVSAGS